MDFSRNLLILISVATLGGILSRLVKIHILIGFILSGVLLKILFPQSGFGAEGIAQLGLIFLLFTTGLELSIDKLSRVLKIALLGATIQVVLVTAAGFILLTSVGLSGPAALVLSLGFSLSSTAVVVKLLVDKNETDTIHGEVMIGWLLIQDLLVIPMLFLVEFLYLGENLRTVDVFGGLGKVLVAVSLIFVLGKKLAPRLLHWISSFNNRELLILASLLLALGSAFLTSLLGVSTALGAFLAGIVISESLEKHAVFAEIRPLRDLFVGIFFVSLGLLITPAYILPDLGIIFGLAAVILAIKFIANFLVSLIMGYHGRTSVTIAIGLSQVGEFSFIIYSLAKSYSLISERALTIGVATALVSLVLFPAIFKRSSEIWRRLKVLTGKWPYINKKIIGWDKKSLTENQDLSGHVIVCGYGRVGSWVGRALESLGITFVAIEYNQRVVDELKQRGTPVIYGDPTEKEVLEAANINEAKALVIAIPDTLVREGVISQAQTIAPEVKIITRVHSDEDWEKSKLMKVAKVVQPEFEGAVAIVKSMLTSMGKPKEEISQKIKLLRLIRARKIK